MKSVVTKGNVLPFLYVHVSAGHYCRCGLTRTFEKNLGPPARATTIFLFGQTWCPSGSRRSYKKTWKDLEGPGTF
jgi:hypothetical protein